MGRNRDNGRFGLSQAVILLAAPFVVPALAGIVAVSGSSFPPKGGTTNKESQPLHSLDSATHRCVALSAFCIPLLFCNISLAGRKTISNKRINQQLAGMIDHHGHQADIQINANQQPDHQRLL